MYHSICISGKQKQGIKPYPDSWYTDQIGFYSYILISSQKKTYHTNWMLMFVTGGIESCPRAIQGTNWGKRPSVFFSGASLTVSQGIVFLYGLFVLLMMTNSLWHPKPSSPANRCVCVTTSWRASDSEPNGDWEQTWLEKGPAWWQKMTSVIQWALGWPRPWLL